MKRKVLFVIHQLNFGGVQKALINVLKLLDYSENEVTLYIRKHNTELLDEVNENVRVIVNEDNTRYDKKPDVLLYGLSERLASAEKKAIIHRKIVEKLDNKRRRFEISHYFNRNEKYDVAISYIQGYNAKFVSDCVNADKKYVFFHGSVDEDHELHEEIFPKFDKIFAVNKPCSDVLKGLYPRVKDKISFVDNYVDYKQIRELAKEFEVEKSNGGVTLCSCGRFTDVKGFDIAAKAAEILKKNGLKFKWYFVGDGPQRGKIEDIIKSSSLENYITITGMQKNPYPYIDACDVFVQPSREDAQPLSIIEARLLFKPVVATKTIGAKDLVKEDYYGILSEIECKSLAYATEKLISDIELTEKIKENLFSIDCNKYENNLKDVWRRLLIADLN